MITLAGGAAVLLAGGAAVANPWLASSTTGAVLTVAADGTGQYASVQAAIDAVPAGSDPHTIMIGKGDYYEAVDVPATKKHLTLQGATGNPDDVVIVYGKASGAQKQGGGTYGLEGSATATFRANDFTARNLTFVNSFAPGTASFSRRQAVAVSAQGDRQVFQNDRIISTRNTVLAGSPVSGAQNRQYFRNVVIAGTTDILSGNATAVFDRSTLQMLGGSNGTLTAASTDEAKKHGFLITNSTVNAPSATATKYLGHPWHPKAHATAQVTIRETGALDRDQDQQPLDGRPRALQEVRPLHRVPEHRAGCGGQRRPAPTVRDAGGRLHGEEVPRRIRRLGSDRRGGRRIRPLPRRPRP